jgi:hypothetical protein
VDEVKRVLAESVLAVEEFRIGEGAVGVVGV